ncbi:unnamed protein product [Rotaria magnacalcarata]|uniref:G-protein coupled receptors family 3 profile domain-containing protein n=4 Tax=Rotaria magnacalcarata TaxID=392030 RepID=A0A818X6W9_9BILA|nr:unnamed protein product [Rotaria magnacalcarata]CAF3857674.1 unnamed protein product [Rotaria magnacalcarata]
MYSQCLIVFVLITSSVGNPANKLSIIHIGALFDFEHPSVDTGRQDLQAAQIAITEINHRHKDLFYGNYVLQLISNNSRCDPIYAVDAFFHAIFRRPQLHFLVGTSCSNETKAVIDVADYYNLILFSHSTSFISQANQSYSTLVRLSVSDENYNDARVAFIKYNNWSHTAIIHQDSIEQSLMMAKLAKYLNESNINVLFTQSASRLNLTSALQNLQEKKARIVFVNFDTSSRAIFFCEVYRTFIKEVRERYIWILTGNDYDSWNFSISNCTKKEVLDAAHGHIIIDSSYTRKPSFINPNMTAHRLQQRLHLKTPLGRQTLHAYDAIWVIALLIRTSLQHNISIDEFTYNSVNMRDSWLTLLEEIHFLGVSGPVSFRNRQRQAETVISQFQIDIHRRYPIRIIAEYSQISGFNTNCSKCRTLLWPNKMPVDTERTEIRRVILKFTDIILVTVVCVLGLGLAIFFLIFNIIHRHERYIKLSSPKLNNVLIIGAMHIHIAILLFGFDQWFLEHNIPGHACIVRIFLFSGGFSLTFGSMFLKTLRVYRIFISNDRSLLHSKLLQDYYLLLICLYLYGIDAIFTIVWQYFDPHFIVFAYGSIRRLDMDTVVSDEICYCNSKYRQKILPFIYLYKSLFLIVGGYLAAKTRHVHIAALNDSKFIVWSIYIVVLTSLFTVIVMLSIQNLRVYIVLCFVVIIMTSVIICLVFLPKVLKLKHRNQGEVVSKELYMDDSRTRRLAVEISYFEAHRYAQLQNRELKTELIRLNHALVTLQQRLESTSTTVTMTLFPLAVRFASTFLQKTDVLTSNTLSNHKTSSETVAFDKEAMTIGINSNEENDKNSIVDTTTSVDSFLHEFKQQTTSLSSSDSDLSVALHSFIDASSLRLSSTDNQQNVTTDNEVSSSLSPIQIMSDNESVLYLHLANELNMTKATLDSDFDRIDR